MKNENRNEYKYNVNNKTGTEVEGYRKNELIINRRQRTSVYKE